jgi:hypothetical protein
MDINFFIFSKRASFYLRILAYVDKIGRVHFHLIKKRRPGGGLAALNEEEEDDFIVRLTLLIWL